MREFDKVGVVGLGAMGAGIVEVFARAGFDVLGVEVNDEALEQGRQRLGRSLERAVSRGKLSADEQAAIVGRVDYSTSRDTLSSADFVVEAVPERPDIKREVFADLDRVCSPGTILATNTSSLSVTEIAAWTSRAGRVVGLHFFNPAPVMKLVEVVGTVTTDPDVLGLTSEVAKRLGKTPVTVTDRAGFVANALLVPYLNDAIRAHERRIAAPEAIDAAVTEAAGLPMGPLTLADMVGLDVCLAVMDVLWAEYRTPRCAATPLLRRMVAAGHLGRKSGRGIYDYSAPARTAAPPTAPPAPLADLVADGAFTLAELLLTPHLNDALWMISEGYADRDDVDTAMRLGCGYPQGPTELVQEFTAASVLESLRRIADAGLGDNPPAPVLRRLAAQP